MSRTYSKDLLEDYEAKKFEYNGKKLTEYEALQEQRHIERGIRRWKREQNALAAAGLDTSEATAKVREWNWKHSDFLEQTGLKPDGTRMIVGRGKLSMKSSVQKWKTETAQIPNIYGVSGMEKDKRKFSDALDMSNGDPNMVLRLRLYSDATPWKRNNDADTAFVYNLEMDAIIYNPTHARFKDYDKVYCQAHELSHRVDYLEIETWNNSKFKKAIELCRTRVYDKKEDVCKLVTINGKYGNDPAFSDIISALTQGELNDYMVFAHEPQYWKKWKNVSLEIFANIACIDVLEYPSKAEFAGLLKEVYEVYKEMIK